jgi:hypothetical protein
MFDRLSNNEIATALDELIAILGVEDEMVSDDLISLLQNKDTKGCVQEIAARLGLPIRIDLSYVPKDFKPGNKNRFRSSALAQTDETGRGIEGITAQVSIPQHLPMFGTSGLQGYPIQVRVSENCHEWPGTFVTVMVHELSHVLLASLGSIHKNSELHVDLVPIILGFRDVVRGGRKTTQSTTSGDTITTQTTTYGYLTDSQFEFACNYVYELLDHHSHEKERLLELVRQLQLALNKATQSLSAFRDSFRYLDSHPPKKMSKEHAERVVQLHGRDYTLEWEERIEGVRKIMKNAKTFVQPLYHYWTNTVEHIKTHIRVLEAASKELNQIIEATVKDENILRKYSGFIYRLLGLKWRHS